MDPKLAKLKELRDRTDLPLLKCKKALEEADWDVEKALEILRRESTTFLWRL